MSKKAKIVLVTGAIAVLALVIVVLLRSNDADSPLRGDLPAATGLPDAASAEAAASETSRPEAKSPAENSGEIDTELAEIVAGADDVISALDLRIEVKERMGWDKVQSLTTLLAMRADGFRFFFPKVLFQAIPWQRAYISIGSSEEGPFHSYYYAISGLEGIVDPMGLLAPEGSRRADRKSFFEGSEEVFKGEQFVAGVPIIETVEFREDTAVVSATEFGGESMGPEGFLVLTQRQGQRVLETIVDRKTMRVRGTWFKIGDRVIYECREFTYEEVAEGVLYPTAYELVMDSATITRGTEGTVKITVKSDVTEVGIVGQVQ